MTGKVRYLSLRVPSLLETSHLIMVIRRIKKIIHFFEFPAIPRLLSITNGRTGNRYKNGESVSITYGRTLNLTCSVQDARPTAELEWQVPEEVQVRLGDQFNAVHDDAYVSRRVVSVTPSRDDDKKIFRCVASHRELDSGLQSFIRLDVQGDYLTNGIIP